MHCMGNFNRHRMTVGNTSTSRRGHLHTDKMAIGNTSTNHRNYFGRAKMTVGDTSTSCRGHFNQDRMAVRNTSTNCRGHLDRDRMAVGNISTTCRGNNSWQNIVFVFALFGRIIHWWDGCCIWFFLDIYCCVMFVFICAYRCRELFAYHMMF